MSGLVGGWVSGWVRLEGGWVRGWVGEWVRVGERVDGL